jgi:hypothetical protein
MLWFRHERYRRFLDTELGRPRRPEQTLFGGFLWRPNPDNPPLNPAPPSRRWWQWR